MPEIAENSASEFAKAGLADRVKSAAEVGPPIGGSWVGARRGDLLHAEAQRRGPGFDGRVPMPPQGYVVLCPSAQISGHRYAGLDQSPHRRMIASAPALPGPVIGLVRRRKI